MMKERNILNRFCITLCVALLFFSSIRGFTQSSSLLSDGTNDFLRRSQLLGRMDLRSGLMSRSFSGNYQALDSLLPWQVPSSDFKKQSKKLEIKWLPLSMETQYNSHHPYGSDQEEMIPARGVQAVVSGGVHLSSGRWSLQLKPAIVYAQNQEYETFPTDHYPAIWEHYYQWLNTSDIPEKFGKGSYKHFYPGQSSIRYNLNRISIGLSTENIWWGPGSQYALVMSNHAPGFAHFTVNTTKPIQTKIGSFEGQFVAGILSSSGVLPLEPNRYGTSVNLLYVPKRTDSRYLSGLTLTWQPKWTKGLFLGFTSVSYLYPSDITAAADIFPLKGIISSGTEKAGKKAGLGSLFVRYVMPEEKAELYVEYGRSDKSPTLLNIIGDQGYPRAYVAGFRKLFATKRNAYLQFLSEFTQMQLPTAELIQSAASWYTDAYVRQGYTNNGRVMGAGIGPGSNSQMADISWVKGYTKLGIQFERIAHNNDFFYNTFTNDYTRHWIDLSTTFHIDWRVKKFLLSSHMSVIRSLNYQWYILPALGYFNNGYDVLNFQGSFSFAYAL
jgi:hypothetical protein